MIVKNAPARIQTRNCPFCGMSPIEGFAMCPRCGWRPRIAVRQCGAMVATMTTMSVFAVAALASALSALHSPFGDELGVARYNFIEAALLVAGIIFIYRSLPKGEPVPVAALVRVSVGFAVGLVTMGLCILSVIRHPSSGIPCILALLVALGLVLTSFNSLRTML